MQLRVLRFSIKNYKSINMNKYLFSIVALFLCTAQANAQWQYPPTKTVDSSDTYFGVTYKDPYRWLENLKDPEVIKWFKAQAGHTDNTLEKIPGRKELLKEFEQLNEMRQESNRDINYVANTWFYLKNSPSFKTNQLFIKKNGQEQLLFDPAAYDPGKNINILDFLPSPDASKVIISYSRSGSEIQTIKVLNVATKTFLPDSIYPSRFGPGNWLPGGKGFTYSLSKTDDISTSAFKLNTQSKVHQLGTPVSADQIFFGNEAEGSPEIAENEFPFINVSETAPKYAIGSLLNVRRFQRIYIKPTDNLTNETIKWKPLCSLDDELINLQDITTMLYIGEHVYAVSAKNASNLQLLRTSIINANWKNATVIAPEKKDKSLQAIANSKDFIYMIYSDGVIKTLYRYEIASKKTEEILLPTLATNLIVNCPNKTTNTCYVTIFSPTKPFTEYKLDGGTGKFSESDFNKPITYPQQYGDIESKVIQVPGHDGTLIPMTLVYKKGVKLDGKNICYLTGYGSYGISSNVTFGISTAVFISKGVILATAHVRGGGEKGEAWRKAGSKVNKSNTWKDLISCAEYLIKTGYSSPEKLCGGGTSAGGIMIGRAVEERPDLFKAAIPQVGAMNMLRFPFVNQSNIPEFGNITDSIECKALYEMDSYQHVKKSEQYPSMLVTTAWNDTRIVPWIPAKFAAAMQNSDTKNPVLLKVYYDDGHGGSNLKNILKNNSYILAYLLWQCGHPDYQLHK
jgi:prolyl oligopeptidase